MPTVIQSGEKREAVQRAESDRAGSREERETNRESKWKERDGGNSSKRRREDGPQAPC